MGRYTILFIDDDAAILRTLGNYFEQLGHVVHRASSGKDGIALHERVRPDVTVLDLFMPEVSGMEVLEALRKRDAPVIMLTSHGEVEAAVKAMKLGAENFLIQPVDVVHLQAAVERAGEKAALRSENVELRQRLHPGMKRRLGRAVLLVLLVAISAVVGWLIGGGLAEVRPRNPSPDPLDSQRIEVPTEGSPLPGGSP